MTFIHILLLSSLNYAQALKELSPSSIVKESAVSKEYPNYPIQKEIRGTLDRTIVEFEDGRVLEDYIFEDERGFLWGTDFANVDVEKTWLKIKLGKKSFY